MRKLQDTMRHAAACVAVLFCLAAAPEARAYGDDVFHFCSEAPGDFLASEQRLSVVWQELKSMLPQKKYAALLKEQRAWLKERDKKAGAASSMRAQCDSYARENRKRIALLERRLPSSGQASGYVPGLAPSPAPQAAPAPVPASGAEDWMGQPAPASGGK